MKTCELCNRSGEDHLFEDHHLYPGTNRRKQKNRTVDTICVCRSCGDQIHLMFTNQQLRTELDNLLELKTAIESYINWVRKKPIEDIITVKAKKRK